MCSIGRLYIIFKSVLLERCNALANAAHTGKCGYLSSVSERNEMKD